MTIRIPAGIAREILLRSDEEGIPSESPVHLRASSATYNNRGAIFTSDVTSDNEDDSLAERVKIGIISGYRSYKRNVNLFGKIGLINRK